MNSINDFYNDPKYEDQNLIVTFTTIYGSVHNTIIANISLNHLVDIAKNSFTHISAIDATHSSILSENHLKILNIPISCVKLNTGEVKSYVTYIVYNHPFSKICKECRNGLFVLFNKSDSNIDLEYSCQVKCLTNTGTSCKNFNPMEDK